VPLAKWWSLSALGNSADLASLTVNATAIALNGSGVNTTGSQSYSGNITLGNTVNARASGASAIITANNAINSDTAGARGLTLNASGNAGSVVVQSAVGNATALANLTFNASAIALNGSNITTSGDQSLHRCHHPGCRHHPHRQQRDHHQFGLDHRRCGNSLAVVGNASIGGDVSNVSTVDVSGTTRLAANVSSTGNQTYVGAITLGADATVLTNGSSAVITTTSTVNSDGTARALTLSATGATGQVVVASAVGDTAALGALAINANSVALNGATSTPPATKATPAR
jgi:mucin-19